MTFQYFFFDTYIGYFLQVLPIALAAGLLTLRHRRKAVPTGGKPRRQTLWFFFSSYLAGLLALTLLPRGLLTEFWYRLFYGGSSGATLFPALGGFNFIPNFWRHLRQENLGNLLMFLPFGVLYPLCRPQRRWRDAALAGLCLSLGIEILQPFLGRSFDINDLILNTLGAALGAGAVFLARRLPPAKRI
ncbi:MAG: VanZ family protein [Oscillospiraceae bacterium]